MNTGRDRAVRPGARCIPAAMLTLALCLSGAIRATAQSSDPSAQAGAATTGKAPTFASMFEDLAGSPGFGDTVNNGVTSPLAWATSHGKSWENDYRADILKKVQATGADTLVYIADGAYGSPPGELAMFLTDMQHPEDGHHLSGTDSQYESSVAVGIKRHIAILRDSPDSKVAVSEQAVKDLVAAYKGSRFEVIFSLGLETNRNTTVAEAIQLYNWFKTNAPNNRIIVGSASVDYLTQVASGASGIELWLEQETSGGNPLTNPLTTASVSAYISSLDTLASAAGGASKVWAGEWWAADASSRQIITGMIIAKGYNCAGGGQYASSNSSGQ